MSSDEGKKLRRRDLLQGLAVALFAVAAVGLNIYSHLLLHTDAVYSHFAYVPVVLSCMWWGRKGLLVTVPVIVLILATHLFALGPQSIGGDLVRAALILAVALIVGILKDRLTEAEERLRLSEEKYRLLTEKSPAGILVYRDDHIVFGNSRVGNMLGYRLEELIGQPVWDFGHEDDRARVRDFVRRLEGHGRTDLHYEWRLRRKDGKTIWADVTSSVEDFEGEPAVLVHLYDITDRKEAEAKQRELTELASRQEEQLVHSTRLAEMGEMAAGVAHELNQPLTGIKNFAKNAWFMIAEKAGTIDEVKENLRLISDQVDRASRIINQMRELARRSERQLGPVDINSALRESTEFLMPQFRLSGVTVHSELQEGLPTVAGDRIRLEQVFLNLLSNARQAMEETEERQLWVRTRLDTGNDCPVVVEVQDTGIGFAPQNVEKLFRPFYSTKKGGRGTGLGLSISLSIIREHRGKIDATGMPGKGATFTVRLPAGEPAAHQEGPQDGR